MSNISRLRLQGKGTMPNSPKHRRAKLVLALFFLFTFIFILMVLQSLCASDQDTSKNGVLAVQTLRNNIMASTLLASTAIMLCSLIAVLMTNGGQTQSDSPLVILGDRTQFGFSIKFFAILVCFLVAFLFNVQSIRYYSHASILINTPFLKISTDDENDHQQRLTAEYVAAIVNRGSYFWSLGLRAFYFSFPLFLWIFGPIPMFSTSLLLVSMLYFLDVTFEFCRTDGNLDYLPHTDEEEEIGK